jgi:hypothetical protein
VSACTLDPSIYASTFLAFFADYALLQVAKALKFNIISSFDAVDPMRAEMV